ncbi:MAG: DUF2182 domain-containing protein [Gammaproteobacteria bacterium]|nr:DUF2182 domain-containing protein [Gammaproteobacteria bacterium]MDE2251329.1 DUF2182 domain-containing protein [Gammaproteobacteria bacterium]
MDGMPMPGGWTMSMAWMRLPGQSWPGAAATFAGMWTVMMVAMMLPAMTPVLARYRQALGRQGALCPGALALVAALGYFTVWALIGLVTFTLGVVLSGIEMQWPAVARAVPAAAGAVVLAAGALQFTTWKARQLAACCDGLGTAGICAACHAGGAGDALRRGLRLGLRCARCCAGLTAVLLAVGVMDLRAMVGITAAITLERLAPAARPAAFTVGGVIGAAGLVMLARAATGC